MEKIKHILSCDITWQNIFFLEHIVLTLHQEADILFYNEKELSSDICFGSYQMQYASGQGS
jgi:hypothetical protein